MTLWPPSDWDWPESSVEVVTPVKNQGQCSCCLAFSTAGCLAIAGTMMRLGKPLIRLAAERLGRRIRR